MKKLDAVVFNSIEKFPEESLFQYFGSQPYEFKEQDVTVETRFNTNGFRSDEFVKGSDKDIIVCAGCSVTFGVGLAEEESWPTILKNTIGQETSEMYNISRPGWSAYDIVYNVFLYLHNFKKPSEIYILLPDDSRTSGYSLIHNVHGTFALIPGREDEGILETEEIRLSNAIHIKNYLFMLEEYCRAQEIKLFVSTWSENNFINKNNKVLKNYYPYDKQSAIRFVRDYEEQNPDSDFILYARDNSHHGVGFHAYWAEMFYKARKESL